MPYKKKHTSKKAAEVEPSTSDIPSEPQWQFDALSDKPLFFWKPDAPYGYFCQWYRCPITISSPTFNCCEQYMMYLKAVTFSDTATASLILSASNPRKQKALGKQVKGFDADIWDQVKYDVVLEANLVKFREGWANNDAFVYGSEGRREGEERVSLKRLLLATEKRTLAGASSFDRIWGIEIGLAEAKTRSREHWGMNLLGRAWMEVREVLRKEEDDAREIY